MTQGRRQLQEDKRTIASRSLSHQRRRCQLWRSQPGHWILDKCSHMTTSDSLHTSPGDQEQILCLHVFLIQCHFIKLFLTLVTIPHQHGHVKLVTIDSMTWRLLVVQRQQTVCGQLDFLEYWQLHLACVSLVLDVWRNLLKQGGVWWVGNATFMFWCKQTHPPIFLEVFEWCNTGYTDFT